MDKPKDMAEYLRWLPREWGGITSRTKLAYDEIVSIAMRSFEGGNFWRALVGRFEALSQEYRLTTDYELFMKPSPPGLLTKPFDSYLIKTFRKSQKEAGTIPTNVILE
jgi:hypothetical protein